MNEWKEFTDNMFGDFVSEDYRYGIWRNNPSDYFVSITPEQHAQIKQDSLLEPIEEDFK